MNKYVTRSLWITITTAIALGVTSCSPPPEPSVPEEPPLTGATIGGDFTLTDENGETRQFSDFNGQYRILYFGYTFCPDVCPLDMQVVMQGLKLFEKEHPARGKNIQPLFITIDPERDTQEALKEYTAAFHPRLLGLTGSDEAIAETASKFAVQYYKNETPGMAQYLMDHSRQTYLFGPAGEPLALLPYDGTPQQVADELERWTK